MKKLILVLLVLSTVLSLFGCAQVQEPESGSHIHNWIEATCTKPITCTLCGETRGFPAGHRFNLGYCDFCSATDPTYGTQPDNPDIPEETVHTHSWSAATCFVPEYCTTCGVIGNAALGHTYTSGKCERCGTIQSQSASTHVHNWKSPTCLEPMTCTTCGETIGSPSAHKYTAATCTTPRTCTVCGTTNGSPKNHYWKSANCTTPETCNYCGQTRGTVVHSYISSPFCYRCGAEDTSIKKFSVNETWSVTGSFEFKINSVTQHSLCSSSGGYNNKIGATTAVIIDYTYKSLGAAKLCVDEWCFDVYDGSGVEGDPLYFMIRCDHGLEAQSCTAGGSCTAKLPVALVNKGSKVTVYMNINDNFAKFEIPVTASGSSSGGSSSGSSGSSSSGSSSSGSGSSGSSSSSGNGTEKWNQSTLDKMLDDILQGNAFAGTVKTFANSSLNATNSTARQMDASSATLMATECKKELSAALSAAKSGPEIRLTQGDYATVKDALQAAYNLISGVSGLAVTSSNCGTVANNCKTAATKVDAITMSILRELVWNE